MYKIRKIEFKAHPILGDLKLDFCDVSGKAVDTVIFAGENGVGKSTVLEALYKIPSREVDFEALVELEDGDRKIALKYYYKVRETRKFLCVTDSDKLDVLATTKDLTEKYKINGILSDVDINFFSKKIDRVTSMTLDSQNGSIRSDKELPNQIKQLLIDIQALDDAELSRTYNEAKNSGKDTNNIVVKERMLRFKSAFNKMFEDLTYSKIDNIDNHKEIFFIKNGLEIPIDGLSSGEKQIVYRGCFLLKDANALNGAFVFIDEPEISLHPVWQQKILDYYKGIYTDNDGKQTSQLFVVTHSLFIIHNQNRKNDKVIVMKRDSNGKIIVSDRSEYYKCDSIEVVEDAFNASIFGEKIYSNCPRVYLEGRTDEMYFNKAIEVYGYENVPFEFKWVGYIDNKGQEVNTGKESLNKAEQFLIAQNNIFKNVCLFDSDAHRELKSDNNVISKSIKVYENPRGIKVGIENALVFDRIDLDKYYSKIEKTTDTGGKRVIVELEKMKLCTDICKMDTVFLQHIFSNLKSEIDELIELFKESNN